ncbi:uncharacterized protein LOC108163663 [Drosophila miranda]|uniref:uncharacterized protein LOC108163663 n=1 Tax=Drosophila miranda TaxID=7229 RepID=UPI0007E64A24|nr:uncharacterized protein LOC108163663 [Drosophila miranda]
MKVLIVLFSLVAMALCRPQGYVSYGGGGQMCAMHNGRQVCGEAQCFQYGGRFICRLFNYRYVDGQNDYLRQPDYPPSQGGSFPDRSDSGSIPDFGGSASRNTTPKPSTKPQKISNYEVVEFSPNQGQF